VKRRSSTVLLESYFAFKINVKIEVKGSGLGRPLYSGRVDAGEQQVPPLRRRWRSGLGLG
jgi:hypothetical protein